MPIWGHRERSLLQKACKVQRTQEDQSKTDNVNSEVDKTWREVFLIPRDGSPPYLSISRMTPEEAYGGTYLQGHHRPSAPSAQRFIDIDRLRDCGCWPTVV